MDATLEQRNPAAQVKPQIERDLFVARAARVQTAAGIAQPFDEQPLDEAVDVLVADALTRQGAAATTVTILR